jgi:hypothetical protein
MLGVASKRSRTAHARFDGRPYPFTPPCVSPLTSCLCAT